MSNNNNNPVDPNPFDYDESTAVDNVNPDTSSPLAKTNNNPNEPKGAWDKYFDELDDARLNAIKKLVIQKEYVIDGETYQRKKIRIKEFVELERVRAEFSKEKDPVKSADLLIKTYQLCAKFYLGVPEEKFPEMDWEVTKIVLDACNFKTLRGLPN